MKFKFWKKTKIENPFRIEEIGIHKIEKSYLRGLIKISYMRVVVAHFFSDHVEFKLYNLKEYQERIVKNGLDKCG